MNDAPEHVVAAMRARYPGAELGIQRHPETGRLHVTQHGRRTFALEHEDGRPMWSADGCTAEILRTLGRSNACEHAGAFRRRLREQRRQGVEPGAAAAEAIEARRPELREQFRVMTKGPRPFVGPSGKVKAEGGKLRAELA